MYQRPPARLLIERLREEPRHIQILTGPRQVGKTTLVGQILQKRPPDSRLYAAADDPTSEILLEDLAGTAQTTATSTGRRPDSSWLVEQWQRAKSAANAWSGAANRSREFPWFVFVVDEIQKVPQWPDLIKGLWDATRAKPASMHVVLLGSSPLLLQKGLKESLAGRYEVTNMSHWSFEEMNDAFGLSLDHYIYFGGYPGSNGFIHQESRWREYVLRGLIEPNIEKDILMMTRVDKPALLKQLFDVGCEYSGQIVALDKVLGRLTDAGNVTTLTRYLDLLGKAGLLVGLEKYSDHLVRRRKSPPKFTVLNTALMSATGTHSFAEARADRSHWGRLVESAVGAHLCNTTSGTTRIHYWRESPVEVDYVIEHRGRLAAVEVKSGSAPVKVSGLEEFLRRHSGCRRWIVGANGIPVGEFLRYPAAHWVG
ncbi:MAG TPA: ATP-binding protein [Burkholderiaceae bacterium]|nr:ATP-binding protein [Burkholderiaceae bacterium]